MTNLSRDQVNAILQNAPQGVDRTSILDGLVDRGYSLEGVDMQQARSQILQKRASTPLTDNPFDRKIGQEGGIGGTIKKGFNFLFGGGKLAQGAGQALAGSAPVESMSTALQQGQDIELKLIKAIRVAQQAGQDTSRLEKALFDQQKSNIDAQKMIEGYTGALKTNKEVVGSATRLAGSVAAPTIGGAAASKLGGAGVGVAQGAAQGAKIGAVTGAAEGAIQGAGISLEKNRSAAEVLYGSAIGATGGAITGGLLGGAIGAWGGYKSGQQVKAESFADDLTSPKLTAKERAKAIAQGRLDEPGLFKKATIRQNQRDINIADSVRDVVDPKKTIGQNVDAIQTKISNVDSGIEKYVRENNSIFNKNQVKSRLMSGKDDLDLIFASDASAEKTYNKVVDAFMEQIKKGNTESLLRARKDFDSLPAVKKLLNTDTLGENARREIVLTVRRQANEYMADLLPRGNTLRADLLQEHYMLEALSNIGAKAANVIGKNQIQMMLNQYPILRTLGGVVLGAGGSAAIYEIATN